MSNHFLTIVASFTHYLRKEQNDDPVISKALYEIESDGTIQTGQFKKYTQMKVRFGLLYKGHKIVVSKRCRIEVLNHVHNSTHAGVQRTYEDLRGRFFGRGMFLDTQSFCKGCEICLRSKRSYERRQPLKSFKLPYNFPRALIAMDIAHLPWTFVDIAMY